MKTFFALATLVLAASGANAQISHTQYIGEAYLNQTGEVDGDKNIWESVDMKPLIVGGIEVTIGRKTYVSGLRSSAGGRSFCGGSLITPKHVLTAAHCMVGITNVAVGTHYLSGTSDGEQLKVVKQTRHPKYNSNTNSWDFLVLELEKPSKFAPVALAKADGSDFVVGATSTAMGWGTTSEGGSQSNVLRRVNLKIIDNKTCSKNLDVDTTMLCAGGQLNKDSCQGDSGGPLVVEKSGGDVLIGAVSWGIGCGRLNYPGVYARVSVARTWIDSVAPGVKWR
jgi:secreted trypsin-like serine protease